MSRTDRKVAQRRGRAAERFVAECLRVQGWRILAWNWAAAGAELDLIAERHGALRFIEVKARQVGDDSGLEAIDSRKQSRLIRAAEAWLARAQEPREAAFAIALVHLDPAGWSVEWIDDAFDA